MASNPKEKPKTKNQYAKKKTKKTNAVNPPNNNSVKTQPKITLPQIIDQDYDGSLNETSSTKESLTSASQLLNKKKHSETLKTDKQLLNDVMNSLDCPICFEFLKAPIFLCESGHDICGKCRAKLCLPFCPLCKAIITNQRNFRLEEIVEKMVTSCVNASFGCKFTGSKDEVQLHYEGCLFRQYLCPLGKEFKTCVWSGSRTLFKKHFSESHPKNILLKPGTEVVFSNFDLTKLYQDLQLICKNELFYLYHMKVDLKRKMAFWSIQQLGINNSKKSSYEFSFYNPRKSKKAIFSEICHPENMTSQDIYNSGNCVVIPLCVLNHFLHEKKLTFKFFLNVTENSV